MRSTKLSGWLLSTVAFAATWCLPLSAIAASSNETVFDVTVSIHNAPAGDNDASTDDGANDDEQNAYETIFQHFTDAVCEQTNGEHKIGEVRIFKNFKLSGSVDIKWGDMGRPAANPTGIDKAGWQILMYDNFGSIKVSNGGTDLQKLGYIVGHEWGHYALGVYDEYRGVESNPASPKPYQPVDGDVAVDESIMHRGRTAVGGDYKWLNHSTSNNIGDVTKTAQGRVYGKSGWETLIQTTNNDPTTVNAWNLPSRTHYTALVGAEPTAADNWFKIELPANQADCRNQLSIVWVDDLEIDIVLDRSGSMRGTPITNAKAAAKTLVDLFEEGTTAAGVTSFNSSVTSNAPITAIPDPGTTEKNTLKSAIDTISASGLTAIYDGAVFSLNKLQTFSSTNITSTQKIVFLLSDGLDNSSSETLSTTVNKFNAAKVPIFTFGYGTSFDQNLINLANQTGGTFTQSPTTAAEIQNAFSNVFAAVSGSATLATAVGEIDPGTTEAESFVIDSTIESAVITSSYTGSVGDLTLVLNKDGTDTGITFNCSGSGSSVSCMAQLSASDISTLGTGQYDIVVTNTVGSIVDGSINVVGTPKDGGTYTVNVDSLGGSTISYPDPIVLSLVVSREMPITGVTVSAVVMAPDGTEAVIDMNDDGVGADRFANDGLYSVWAPYSQDGTYTIEAIVSNPSGSASYTGEALAPSHWVDAQPEPGETIPDPVLPPDNFTRVGLAQITVSGAGAGDDHTDFPTGGSCTTITNDNTKINGIFDFAGDVDCFSITGPLSGTEPVIVRVFNIGLNADPKFTVFASDGTTQIADVDPSVVQASNGALFVEIDAANVDMAGMIVAVSDVDPAHSGGFYSISAGPELVSDKSFSSVPSGDDDSNGDDSNGLVGLWMLALFGALGLIGLVGFRHRHV